MTENESCGIRSIAAGHFQVIVFFVLRFVCCSFDSLQCDDRIRKELKGFSTFLEIPRMQEEKLFQQCADEVDSLFKRIKLLYSVCPLSSFQCGS